MALYLIRRIINYLILTAVASCLAYVLASLGLNPIEGYLGKHPRPSQATLDGLLNYWGANPKVPLIVRTWTWFTNIFHGNLGQSVQNQPVTGIIITRAGVSLELLLIGSIMVALCAALI